jgi:hypothetical protein
VGEPVSTAAGWLSIRLHQRSAPVLASSAKRSACLSPKYTTPLATAGPSRSGFMLDPTTGLVSNCHSILPVVAFSA